MMLAVAFVVFAFAVVLALLVANILVGSVAGAIGCVVMLVFFVVILWNALRTSSAPP